MSNVKLLINAMLFFCLFCQQIDNVIYISQQIEIVTP